MRDLKEIGESVIHHTYDGVEYQIFDDPDKPELDNMIPKVVIGRFALGSFRMESWVSKEFMQEEKYLDWMCIECRRLCRKFTHDVLPEKASE